MTVFWRHLRRTHLNFAVRISPNCYLWAQSLNSRISCEDQRTSPNCIFMRFSYYDRISYESLFPINIPFYQLDLSVSLLLLVSHFLTSTSTRQSYHGMLWHLHNLFLNELCLKWLGVSSYTSRIGTLMSSKLVLQWPIWSRRSETLLLVY